MKDFINNLEKGIHQPGPYDAEYITRFEIQKNLRYPDYELFHARLVLMRQMEAGIWDDTKEWLNKSEENRLLIVLDEAHCTEVPQAEKLRSFLTDSFHVLIFLLRKYSLSLRPQVCQQKTKELFLIFLMGLPERNIQNVFLFLVTRKKFVLILR